MEGGQTIAQAPPPRVEAPPHREGPPSFSLSGSPFLVALVGCVALAALSAALLPTVPSYDPWSWIVWGRELVDPHLSFATGGGPSWKPLPVVFTTVFGLFGGAAPTLWVITARAGGLLALVAAYRLGARLAGPGRWAAVAAGTIAAAGILLTQDWFYYLFRGTSEPLLVCTALWAIDLHLDRRLGSAFVFAVGASLIRPEAWPFTVIYAVWLWIARPRLRALAVAGVAAIPLLWFVPPWIGSGQPFLAASHAKEYNGHLGRHPLLEVLRRGADLQVLPALIGALVAVALAWLSGRRAPGGSSAGRLTSDPPQRDWKRALRLPTGYRDRLTIALAACALAWWVLVVGMTAAGYPGLERFYLPAAGITCALAGAGFVRVAQLVFSSSGRLGRAGGSARAALLAGGVLAALIAVSIPFTTGRISSARAQKPSADRAVERLKQLSAAVAAVGGHRAVFPCRSSFAAVNHGVQTALAWKLHVTLGRVGTSLRHQGVLFVGPHDSIDGSAAPISPRLTRMQLLAQAGAWRVYRVTRPGAFTRCVGR